MMHSFSLRMGNCFAVPTKCAGSGYNRLLILLSLILFVLSAMTTTTTTTTTTTSVTMFVEAANNDNDNNNNDGDVDVDVDPGADFNGYMQEMDRRQNDEMAYEAKLNAHEEWRQNTFGGWCVRQLQTVANHFRPFFFLIQDALRDTATTSTSTSFGGGGTSTTKVFLYIGVRMFVVIWFGFVVYVASKVFQLFIGNSDYETVEEVVIVHEHATEEEAAKARAGTTRGKKQKSQ